VAAFRSNISVLPQFLKLPVFLSSNNTKCPGLIIKAPGKQQPEQLAYFILLRSRYFPRHFIFSWTLDTG
jgi:hypothetical protein